MTAGDLVVLAQSQDFEVKALDLVVILAYLVVTIGIGWWYSARSGGNEDSEGYFLGGRNFIWPFIGFSLLATNMSGSSFVGFAAAGYTTGVNVYNYEWMAAILLIFAALFVFPLYIAVACSRCPSSSSDGSTGGRATRSAASPSSRTCSSTRRAPCTPARSSSRPSTPTYHCG